ncbi:MAG: hypothetical protein LBG73_01645 [Spirochaetaceae bacterium]|jgi:hypothetical protein|nr:hypothetical protein [Spirochaetaceae bacterium]
MKKPVENMDTLLSQWNHFVSPSNSHEVGNFDSFPAIVRINSDKISSFLVISGDEILLIDDAGNWDWCKKNIDRVDALVKELKLDFSLYKNQFEAVPLTLYVHLNAEKKILSLSDIEYRARFKPSGKDPIIQFENGGYNVYRKHSKSYLYGLHCIILPEARIVRSIEAFYKVAGEGVLEV